MPAHSAGGTCEWKRLTADGGGERILRKESVRLFGSRRSKHLERLTPWLELLVSGDLAAARMED